MKRQHHLGALSDGGGDALDRTRAYVADREHARAIRFQCVTWLAPPLAKEIATLTLKTVSVAGMRQDDGLGCKAFKMKT